MNKNLVYFANVNNLCGYATASLAYLEALEKYTDLNIILIPLDGKGSRDKRFDYLIEKPIPDDYNCVVHCHPVELTPGNWKNIINKAKLKSIMTVWEASEIPMEWRKHVKQFDRVIVPSRYAKSAFEPFHNDVRILPHVVSIDDTIPASIMFDKNKLSFLCVSSMVSHRKGLDILLNAWVCAFDYRDDVELFVKLFAQPREEKLIDAYVYAALQISPNDRKPANIKIICQPYSDFEMSQLYKGCDIHVLPSRGEGFGLPYAEAALYGKPNIFPNQGGMSDFMKDGVTGWGVDCKQTRAITYCIPEIDITNFDMFEPDAGNLVDCLRDAYLLYKTRPDLLKALGDMGKGFVNSLLNPEKIASHAIEVFCGK